MVTKCVILYQTPYIKGFLSILVNNILKMSMQKIGLIVGKFYPLHQGHINMILSAKLAVDELHIFVCSETERDWQLFLESAFTKAPTSQDRVNWAKDLLAGISGITVHGFNEDGIPAYPNGWQAWSDRLKETLKALHIQPTIIFSSELQDKDFYEEYFHTEVMLVDPPRDKFPVSATKIRNSPFQYWTYIPTVIRSFFTRTIIIEEDLSQNPAFLPAIVKLFNAVEVTHYEKIKFETVSQDHDFALIQQHQNENRLISAIIGRNSFIENIQKAIKDDSLLLHNCQLLPVKALDKSADQEAAIAQERALFNEISSFINRLMVQNHES